MKLQWDYRQASANDELQAFYQAFVGHELANRLVAAQGFARVVLSEAEEETGPVSTTLLRRLADQLRSTDELARRVAEVGRLLREPPRGPRGSVAELAQQAVLRVSAVSRRDEIDYSTHVSMLETNLSSRYLLRVFQELLSNATCAIPLGTRGKVTLEATGTPTGWEFCVTDTGTGFSPAALTTIQLPFPVSYSAQLSSHGLGFFLVRQAVCRWRGLIGMESEPGHTVVRLEIPPSEVS
jgi:two-component system OmpR family sensor kinase